MVIRTVYEISFANTNENQLGIPKLGPITQDERLNNNYSCAKLYVIAVVMLVGKLLLFISNFMKL